MKKLVLILVCVIVLTVFIAMNYLLWDRENKLQSYESLNSSKNVSIEALSDKIKTLEESNGQLQATIDDLVNRNKRLTDDNAQIELDRMKLQTEVSSKNGAIEKLKQTADMKDLEEVIKKWIDDVDNGQYENAYKLIDPNAINLTGFRNQDDFSDYFKTNIKSMKYRSVKLVTDSIPKNRIGDLIFKVVLDVKKTDASVDNSVMFSDGQNIRYFKLVFDTEKNNWVISEISAIL